MKKQFLIAMAVVMVCCTSCFRMKFNEFSKLKSSGNIVRNEYKMDAFNKIDIDLVAKVKFVQSVDGDYRVLLRCPDNYVNLFEFKVDDGELEMGFAENIHKGIEANDVSIIVCSPALLQLESEGTAVIVIDSLTTPSLHIDSEGVGNVTINGLHVEALKVESSGVGNILLTGQAKSVSLECDGVGNINAEKLTAAEVEAEVNGVGNISCFASERIKGIINGVGSLKYGGNPRQKDLHRNGVGKISECNTDTHR